MAKICGSVEGAERFRMKVEKENRKSIEIWKKINRELKNLQESGAQEAYEQLQQICNSYGKQFQKVLEELAGVLKQMQMYRDFLVAISRNASLGGAMHAPPARPADMGQVLLSGKAHEIPRQPLAQQDQVSFQGGAYDTVQTTEELVLYRVYGGASSRIGRFLTTRMPTDRMVAKMELALDASWKGTRTQYCEVHIPAGTVLNIGRAGGQVTASGNLLPGGAGTAFRRAVPRPCRLVRRRAGAEICTELPEWNKCRNAAGATDKKDTSLRRRKKWQLDRGTRQVGLGAICAGTTRGYAEIWKKFGAIQRWLSGF